MYKIVPVEGGVCAAEGFFADGIHIGLKKRGCQRFGVCLFEYAVYDRVGIYHQ